jgi:hypothetical protein
MDSDMLASSDEKGTPFTYAYTSRYCPARKISPKAYQVSIKGVSLKDKAQRFSENPARPSCCESFLYFKDSAPSRTVVDNWWPYFQISDTNL